MKRRLINYDVFEKMRNESLTSAEQELVKAETILAHALQLTDAKLNSFDAENVMYESIDGTFIRANYQINDDKISLNNVEQLVIDEETERVNSRDIVSKMLTSLLESDEEKAGDLLSQYLSLPLMKRTFSEGMKKNSQKKSLREARKSNLDGRKLEVNHSIQPFKQLSGKALKSWASLCQNTFEYLDYLEHGPALKESTAQYDDKGNIIAINIPTAKVRNEAKLISLKYKHLPATEVKVLRMKGEKLAEDISFCKAVADLKRQNNISDSEALEEALETIVGRWPEVLYLTQEELAVTLKNALETIGATNYDDQTCDFMSEGILRTAHVAYQDRVEKVMRLAGVHEGCDCEDKYNCFREATKSYYPSLDEESKLEMQVFVDLYEALRAVHDVAQKETNSAVITETVSHLNELAAIIRQDVEPSVKIAEQAASWLAILVETNLETSDWRVSNSTHVTLSGDHPQMAKNARHGYSPSQDFSGDWGDEAPVSDGKNYRGGLANKMRSSAWGNVGGGDTYPSLQNPYVPKAFGDYTIKGEKGVDKDNSPTGQWSSGDTWPNLQNPYVPKSETPQSFKMNQGKEQDLVVDK